MFFFLPKEFPPKKKTPKITNLNTSKMGFQVSCLKASRRAFAAIVGAARSVVTWGDGAFGGDCSAVQVWFPM